jgi:hypothetical protein
VTVERIPESEGKTSQAPDPTVIGRVFPNSTILICAADNLEPLADGTVGEICIAGPQVSRGYKGQEELTKSKFHEITLSDRTTRLYRTGDKGYLTADGKLCIGGRMNNRELKVRGYRVDLHEIEQSILTHNQDVTMTSVQLVEDSLVALVVPSTVNCDIVRQRLMADVPAYAVPAQIIALPRLPLNPNGKVDHNQATEVAKTFMAPSKASSGASTPETVDSDAEDLDHNEVKAQSDQIKTKLIRDLHALWAQVLGTTRRFASDVTFFDAGGHSLSLLKLHSLISERFPRTTLSLLDIFSAATINKQAEKLLPMLEAEYAASSNTSSRLSGPSPGLGTSTPATSVHLSPHDGRFAIVGMSCCFPGGNSLNEFWDILMEQKDGVSTFETPMDLAYELGKDSVFVPRHGTIRGLDDFQPEAWSMTDAEAEALDPQVSIFY